MGRRRGRRGGFRHWLGGRLELPVSACTMHSRTPQPSRLPGSGADRAPRWPVSCPLCPAGSGGEWLRLGQTPNPPTPWGRPGDREGKAGKGPPPPHTNRTRGAGHFWGGGLPLLPRGLPLRAVAPEQRGTDGQGTRVHGAAPDKGISGPYVGSACRGGTEALWVRSPNGRESRCDPPPVFPLHSCPERNLKSCQEGNLRRSQVCLSQTLRPKQLDPLPPKQRGEVAGGGGQDHVRLSPAGCSNPTLACPTPSGPALGLCPSCVPPPRSSLSCLSVPLLP